MPRKSAASVAASDTGPLVSPTSPSFNNGDTSTLSAAPEPSTPQHKSGRGSAGKGDADGLGIDDLLLPRTLTSRLARGILPANTSIQKDALLALTKSATVFISYLASHANEQTTKRTIGPQDVMKALQEIEMGNVMGLGAMGADGRIGGRLERELEVWEGIVRGKRKGYRDSIKAKTRDSEVGADEGDEPELKRVRMDEDDEMENDGQDQDLVRDHSRPLHNGDQPIATAGSQSDPLGHHEASNPQINSHTNATVSPSHHHDLNTMHTHPRPQVQPDEEDLEEDDPDPEDPYQDEEDVEDETDEEEADEEDEEGEERDRGEDDDRYGPDEQLRRGMNGATRGGVVDEVGITDEESD